MVPIIGLFYRLTLQSSGTLLEPRLTILDFIVIVGVQATEQGLKTNDFQGTETHLAVLDPEIKV